MDYIADERLAKLHRKLTASEYKQLEDNCLQDGRILDPIIVWGKYIMDGINRLEIAEKHGLEYSLATLDLDTFDDAVMWVINHQIGKRNISDFEAQRLRAEQVRMLGDTGVVAEQHGVSRRTVQRDVEADDIRQKMSEDIRSRCDKGEIINHRADWKRYGELTDEQRAATDDSLRRNPGLRMGQAIPRETTTLTPDDFITINNSCLSTQQKQSLSLGTLFADTKSVKAFSALAADEQQFVVDILDDPEIDDLGDAILTMRRGFSRTAPEEGRKAEKVRNGTEKTLKKLESCMADMNSLEPNQTQYVACMDAIQLVREAWGAWR